jgi:uncharacterized protein (DUF2164 family)
MDRFFRLPTLILCTFVTVISYSNNAECTDNPLKEIGKKGDAQWNHLIKTHKGNGQYVDVNNPAIIVKNFERYLGKYKQFPKINFADFITDRNGEKYYYYGVKGSIDLYVIKHDQRINDKLIMLSNGLGSLQGEWEVLGVIDDAFRWWGNVVLMKVVAMRIPGKACVVIEENKIKLVGEDLFNKFLTGQEADAYKGLPKNLNSIPKGLDPATVAKLFFYIGSVEKNDQTWIQLLSKDALNNDGSMAGRAKSWWRSLSTKNREYFFVRENPNRVSGDNKKCYMFQIKQKGKNLGSAKPCILIRENGEWKIKSANP